MKVALVHELLTMKGGAEKVLRVLADMFPDAPIYTFLFDEEKLGDWFPKERIHTSILQKHAERLHYPWFGSAHHKLSIIHYPFNHHFHLRSFPRAAEAFDFSGFDLVISSSSAFAHGIITNGNPKHLCYVHSPARYLWDRTQDVQEQAGKGLLGPLKRAYLSRVFHRLRVWDSESADRPDRLIAASQTVQRRIELYWRRESSIVYPPIDDHWLQAGSSKIPASEKTAFLVVSTLARYKRIELAIEACNTLKLPLLIAGDGPDRKRLEKLAGPTVTFLGHCKAEQLRELYTSAKATIFPGDEDFGLVPLESLACGTPVIAFRSGGALETLKENDTALFFDEPTATSLAKTLEQFAGKTFSPALCRGRAARFSRRAFEDGIRREIAALL